MVWACHRRSHHDLATSSVVGYEAWSWCLWYRVFRAGYDSKRGKGLTRFDLVRDIQGKRASTLGVDRESSAEVNPII
jgi:hypothetical protein